MTFKNVLVTVFIILSFALVSNHTAHAKSYYVKPDGNDNHNGLSDATAWRSIDKVNKFKFSTGDDVYFKCGGEWKNRQLLIDWSGTTSNDAKIGAYYLQGNSEVIGISGKNLYSTATTKHPGLHHAALIAIMHWS